MWLVESLAEFIGVFIYTFCGVGATAAFTTTTVAKLNNYGSVLGVSLIILLLEPC